jgi:5-methylcytosine-specific restriction endonuclease McrA
MPSRAPRICKCGQIVQFGQRCTCERGADRERKARFDKTRPNSSARGYNRKWEAARKEWLKAKPYCVRCGAKAAHVDHIIPHKQDMAKFWDKTNWQSLCAYHHNSAKQREERRG